MADAAAREFQDQQRVVLAFRLRRDARGARPTPSLRRSRPLCRRSSAPRRCSGSRDRASRRRRSSSTSQKCVLCGPLCDSRDRTHNTRPMPPDCDHLLRLDHARREHLGLGVAVHRARPLRGRQHRLASSRVAGQRLGADLVTFRLRQLQRHRQVLFVRQRDDVEVDVVACDQPIQLRRRLGNRPRLRERLGALAAARVVDHDPLAGDVREALQVEVRRRTPSRASRCECRSRWSRHSP